MLAYRLDQQIDGNKLLNDIQKLISKSIKQNVESYLIIRVQEISYTNNNLIPKIEYKNLDS